MSEATEITIAAPPLPPNGSELRAYRSLVRAQASLSRQLDAELERTHGLALSSFEALQLLDEQPDGRMRMRDLAEELQISRSGLTRLVDRLAREGDATAVAFPRNRATRGSLDMSFSGLKTSAKYFLASPDGRDAVAADVAASFQAAVVDVLMDRTKRAAQRGAYRTAVLSGGVAANSALQRAFGEWGAASGIRTHVPPLRYCTDNAAMIAAAADRQGEAARADALTLTANPNLPFEPAAGAAA